MANDELDAEVANLKRELANLRAALAERASDVADGANRAANAVVQPIRDHPATAGLVFGGLVGLLVGVVIGQSLTGQQSRSWHDRYW